MEKIRQPRYRHIAQHIAEKIATGEFAIGDKLRARSTLAATYGVSAETARKAISILADLKIVSAQQGSGVTVLSQEKARHFVSQVQETTDLVTLHQQLTTQIHHQQQELEALSNQVGAFFQRVNHLKKQHPLSPYELTLKRPSSKFGLSLGELNFWQNTGATIVGLLHNDELVISPGPYAVVAQGDTVYFVGPDNCDATVQRFFDRSE